MSKDREKRATEFSDITTSLIVPGIEAFERTIYTALNISPETTLEEARKQFKDGLNEMSRIYTEAETKAENEYNTTLESIKAYLTTRGLALPRDFYTFLNWYIIRYCDLVDQFGFSCIEQDHINEYSRERTKELDELTKDTDTPPHKAESINIDEILTDIFPDISPDDLNALNTNLLRNGALKLWSLYYTGTKKKLWVNLGYLRAAGINRQRIADVFGQIYYKKTLYGASKQLNCDEIYQKIDKKGIKR